VVNEVAANFDASGLEDVVSRDGEHGAAIDRAGGDEAGFGLLWGARLARRWGFRHGNNIKHGREALGFRLWAFGRVLRTLRITEL